MLKAVVRRVSVIRTLEHLVLGVFFAVATRLSVIFTPVFSIRARARGRRLTLVVAVGLALLCTAGVSLLRPAVTAADSAGTINFQARLEDKGGAITADGNYNVEFKLYSASTGGTALWTEDYLNSASQGVAVSNGYLSVNLGAITAFPSTIPWGQSLYLTMNIGGTDPSTPSWDGEMDPRLKLTAVPYAYEAGLAAQLQATSGSNVATLSFATPTATDTVTIPDASGTICLENNTACGFAPANGSGQLAYQSGSYTGTLVQDTLGQSTVYHLPDPGAASATICLSTGNCTNSTSNNITTTALLGGGSLSVSGSGSIGGTFSATGSSLFEDSTNSPTALQVKDSGNAAVLTVDTSADRVDIGKTLSGAVGQLYVSGQLAGSAVGDLSGAGSLKDIKTVGNYAYVADATDNELRVYNVSNPASPAQVGSLSTGASTGPSALDVAGRYAYVALATTGQIEVVDISNPASPVAVTTVSGFSDPESVAASGRYVYVANAGANTVGVLDVGNPSSPSLASVSDGYSSGDNPTSLYVQGHFLYMVDNSNNFTAYDVSNPTILSYQNSVSLGAASSCSSQTGARYVAAQGSYAYVTVCGSDAIKVYDISNPAAMSLSSTISAGTGSGPMAVATAGRYLYVALTGANEIGVYDISNPASPQSVGTTTAVSGSTPLALGITGRYAYVADAGNGHLQVYDLGGAYVQQIEAGSVETGSLNVESNGSVGGDFAVQGSLTVGSSAQIAGGLSVGGSLAGNVTSDTKATESSAQTYTETGDTLGYDFSSNSTTTEASFSTTFNVTGLPDMDGTVAFFTVSANKGTTTGSWQHSTVVQINGTTIATVATPLGTTAPAAATTRSFTVMRMGGTWQIVGEGPAAGLDNTSSTNNTADFAEWIPYSGTVQPAPGDVLTVGDSPTSVKDASAPYDNKVIGVVSTTPYSVAGANDGHSVIIALAGRVPVKVSLENGAIKPGDPLTSSSVAGVAMKATQPGQIIGTALEAYDGTEQSNEIMIQLTPGYDNPGASASAAASGSLQSAGGSATTTSGAGVQGSTSILGDLTTSGNANIGGDLTVTGTTTTGSLAVNGSATLGSLTVNGSAGLTNLSVSGTTSSATLTVAGAATLGSLKVTGDAEIDGHLITGGDAPTVQILAPAGTNATVTVTGNDTAGAITLTTGTATQHLDANGNIVVVGNTPSPGDDATVTFKKPYATAPRIILTPNDSKSAPLLIYPDNESTTAFNFSFVNLPASATTYTFNYLVVQ